MSPTRAMQKATLSSFLLLTQQTNILRACSRTGMGTQGHKQYMWPLSLKMVGHTLDSVDLERGCVTVLWDQAGGRDT